MRLKKPIAILSGAAALALTAAPALAAAVTVGLGGSTGNTDQAITGTAKSTTVITVNGNSYTCTGSTLGGTVHGGTSKDPVADITSATWTGCSFTGGLPVTITVTNPDWKLHATSGYTTAANDTVAETLDNISGIRMSIAGPFGTCTFNVSGSVQGTFKEDNGKGGQELDISSNGSALTVSNVNSALNCLGLVSNGNPMTFFGAYNTNTTAGYINIQP